MELPNITGGGKVRGLYRVGPYQAVLVEKPDSVGPIKYLYVLIVYDPGNSIPIFMVTSEQNQLQGVLLEAAKKHFPDEDIKFDPKKCFLCVFSAQGHLNLGGSREWGIFKNFEKKALSVLEEYLKVTADVESNLRNGE